MLDALRNSIAKQDEPFVPNTLPKKPHNIALNNDKKITNKYIVYGELKTNLDKIKLEITNN